MNPRRISLMLFTLWLAACGPLPLPVPVPDLPDEPTEPPAVIDWNTAFLEGTTRFDTQPRPALATMKLRALGTRVVSLETLRDVDGTEQRRLVSRTGTMIDWTYGPLGDERLEDFTLHPSGELTASLEHRAAPRDAFELVRLSADGELIKRQRLARPMLIPSRDLVSGLHKFPFAMKGPLDGSVVSGRLPWLRVEAHGEHVVLALESLFEDADGALRGNEAVSAVQKLEWTGSDYLERWSRMVDGPHLMISVAWQYDDFFWLEAAMRLTLSVEPSGLVVVGRTFSTSRCLAVASVFKETTDQSCRLIRKGSAHRFQPFAYTAFDATGARLGTGVVSPDAMEEFVVFDLATRWPLVALAGTAVRIGADGEPNYYQDPGSPTLLLPYDGWLGVYDGLGAETKAIETHVLDLGRAEALTTLRWTDAGLLAGGLHDWDRWWGGMSVSRAAQPLLVRLSNGQLQARAITTGSFGRHAHLLTVELANGRILAGGLFDAPMTHSGDGQGPEPMSHGSLRLELTP